MEILVLGLVLKVPETISIDTASRLRAQLEAMSGELVHGLPARKAVKTFFHPQDSTTNVLQMLSDKVPIMLKQHLPLQPWLGCRTCYCYSYDDFY